MSEHITVNHPIQKSIIDILMYTDIARFRDLRPARTDTNLFSYHLNSLVKSGMVQKVEGGYTLGMVGLSYVDRVMVEKNLIQTQPKIIIMLLVQNSDGDILLRQRRTQPYINTWTLPYGKLHIEDTSLQEAAHREVREKLGLERQTLVHAGDCYIRVRTKDEVLSTTLVHVFKFNSDTLKTSDDIMWARPHKLAQLRLAPAVEAIMTRGFFNDPFFFEEFEVEWV